MRHFWDCFYIFCFLLAFQLHGEDHGISKEYDVLSLSSAIIDHCFFVTDEQLQSITDEKGQWAPIDFTVLTSMLKQHKEVAKLIPGGSGVNVIKGISALGERCIIIGKVGADDKGDYYSQRLRELDIVPFLQKGTLPTGQALCFITPDGERTFRTYPGASHSLSDLHLDPKIFQKARLFHIEGYQLMDPDLVIRALKLAKSAGMTISIDLANVELVRRNKEFIWDILDKYIDILFCNQYEAEELTGLSPSEACDKLSTYCAIAIVTMSDKGSWARSGDEKVHMDAFSVQVIDTTGAGDLYAAGFLHGHLCGKSLKKCTWLGSIVAAQVVKRLGAEIPQAIWSDIHQTILKEGEAFD